MLIVWRAEDHAIVIAIGRHDDSSEDVYAALLDALELDVPEEEERVKPPCCDEEGRPPADDEIAARISDAIGRRAPARRRRR